MRTHLKSLFLAGLATVAMGAQAETPAPTKAVMTTAYAKAKSSGKNVLVIFHASWCGWCHRFDDFLKEPTGKKLTSGLEIVHIDVLENDGPHKGDENPGGLDFMTALGGKDAGLPFMAIVNPKGKMVINSLDPKNKNQNTGYPGEISEIAHFIHMLEVGAPKLSTGDRKLVNEWLTEHRPKSG